MIETRKSRSSLIGQRIVELDWNKGTDRDMVRLVFTDGNVIQCQRSRLKSKDHKLLFISRDAHLERGLITGEIRFEGLSDDGRLHTEYRFEFDSGNYLEFCFEESVPQKGNDIFEHQGIQGL